MQSIKKGKQEKKYFLSTYFQSGDVLYTQEEYDEVYKKVKKEEMFNIVKGFCLHSGHFSVELSICNDIIIKIAGGRICN